MNLFSKIAGLISLLPYLVAGVNTLHAGAAGIDKKAAVMQLAGIALTGVEMAAPGTAPAIQAAAPYIGTAVDAMVGVFNAFGIFSHSASPAAAAQPPAAAS
jgi:hypothetical protein